MDTIVNTNHIKMMEDNYTALLQRYDLTYSEKGNFLQVGTLPVSQTWIFHISVIYTQLDDLLIHLIPELKSINVSFRIVKSREIGSLTADGYLGYSQLGKVVDIFPKDDQLLSIAQSIISITSDFRGPAIPSAVHIGGCLYATLARDQNSVPFKLPKEINWPFTGIVSYQVPIEGNTLNKKYVKITTLKSDAKGKVFKGIRLDGWRIQFCLVKEGNDHMCVDDSGRDVRQRLLWQVALHKELSEELPLPKFYDLFHEKGRTYLVTEFIKGKLLETEVADIYSNRSWSNLEPSKKQLLLSYIIQVIDAIAKLHAKGYVHRDITPFNFILNKRKKIYMIDVELSYNLKMRKPSPPFRLGSFGFMSPEQRNIQTPTTKEDIYGLGALLIFMFTSLSPIKFTSDQIDELENNLTFYIQSRSVSSLMARCLSGNPENRPSLESIKTEISKFELEIKTSQLKESNVSTTLVDDKKIGQVLKNGMQSLNSHLMRAPGKVWHSNLASNDKEVVNQQIARCHYVGIYAGISGVMYLISTARKNHIDVDELIPVYLESLECIKRDFLKQIPNTRAGLFSGSTGVALAIMEGIHSGIIQNWNNKETISKCLQTPNECIDLAEGISGQGTTMLRWLQYSDDKNIRQRLHNLVELLMSSQQRDGSWIFQANGSKITGLANGVSGIIYFLLKYYEHLKDDQVERALTKALSWLKVQAIKSKKACAWHVSNKDRTISHLLNDGSAGVALCFIKAFEIMSNPVYKEFAERALRNTLEAFVFNDLSFAHGITGLGEVYLEASRVFKQEEWNARAKWIAGIIINTCCTENETCYWVVNDAKQPTADFMIGNSGVLHFLLRSISKNKVSFPII